MNQGIIVYRENGLFKAITRVTREVIVTSQQADKVIQNAVDAMEGTGGQVYLEQGNYRLVRRLNLHDRVRLCGAGRATRLEVSVGTGVLLKDLDSAEVADVAIVAADDAKAQAGLVLDGCGDCKATNVFAAGFACHGIWLRNHSFLCTLSGCSAAGNARSNIFLDSLATFGRAGRYLPNLVTNCIVYGGGKGVEVARAVVANITGTCVFQTDSTGFHVHKSSNSVVINGCRTFQVGKHAVLVEDTDEFNLSGNIFCWHIEDGVVVRNANWGSVTGNEIIDSGSYNSGVEDRTARWEQLPAGLPAYSGLKLLNVKGYNVTGNTVFNWGVCPPMAYGIYEDELCFTNTFVGNNINYFSEKGLLSLGKGSSSQGNLSYADRPHQDRPGLQHWFQTFVPEMKERFVANQVASLPPREKRATPTTPDPDPL